MWETVRYLFATHSWTKRAKALLNVGDNRDQL